MSTIKSSNEHLTLNADGSSKDIKFQANGVEKASISSAGVIATNGASLDGAVTINDTGADVDFRVEGDNKDDALFVQGSNSYVGIGTKTPERPFTIDHQSSTTSLGGTAEVIKIAGSAVDESYCGIGFHYDNSAGQTHSPSFIGYQAKNFSGSTNGDLVLATRSATSDSAPTERMRITSDGRGLSQFTAKFWINFNGTGSIAIRDSHNISSIADNAAGRYSVNIDNNVANVNYAVTAAVNDGNALPARSTHSAHIANQEVGSFEVYTGYGSTTSSNGAAADASTVNLIGFGD